MTGPRWRPWLEACGAAVLVAAIAVAITWPLFQHPATTVLDSPSLYGPAAVLVQRDINLTIWTLAWDVHALVTDPLHLFHANALYPARWSLATTEHMLGNVPFFAPVYLATGNPVFAHQATLLATFVAAALAMAAYVLYWTRDRTAALAAGCLFAFAPYRLWQIGNVHVVSIHWLPLALLGVDVALDGRRVAGAALLAAALVLSTLCSYYVGYAAFALAGGYAIVRLLQHDRAARGGLAPIVAGIGVAALAVGVLTIPYLILQRAGVLPHRARPEDLTSIAFLSLAFQGPARYALSFLTPRREGIPEFLGFTVVALAAAGLVLRRRPPRGALLAGALAGWVLAIGPVWNVGGHQFALPYRWLMAIVPGFSAMRVPQRFGALVTVAATAMAGLALAELRTRLRRLGHARVASVLAVAAVTAALVEARVPGLRTMQMPVGALTPPAYRWLAEHGDGGALIEVPATGNDPLRQSQALVGSTVHWLPLVNGYSAYPPPTFMAFMTAAARLPARDAIEDMLAVAPLRWVLVRHPLMSAVELGEWRTAFAAAGLRVAGEFPGATIFEVPASRRTPRASGAS